MTRRDATLVAGAVFGVVAVGALDWATGPVFGFSLFYILPIALVAWRCGRGAGWVVAGVATGCWLGADLPYRTTADLPPSLWNGFTRLVIYFFVATATARIRADRAQARALNEKLTTLLLATERLARSDGLTGLANSRAFLEDVAAEVARARRSGGGACLAYVDLDNFKKVNDRYGHAGGDDVLKRVADAMRETLRTADVAARLGGDEFAVLLVDTDKEGAWVAAERIVKRIADVARDYPETGLGASVGIAHFARPPTDAEAVIRAADHAMYRAKSAGKGTFVVVDGDAAG